MSRLSLNVNGRAHVVDVDPQCPLLYVLRDNLALNNPRFGGSYCIPSTDTCDGQAWRELIIAGLEQASAPAC